MLNFIRWFFLGQAPVQSVEQWSDRVAPLCSPEQLIAAHIKQDIAKNFDKWRINKILTPDARMRHEAKFLPGVEKRVFNYVLTDGDIVILYRDQSYNYDREFYENFYIGYIEFPNDAGQSILATYNLVKAQWSELERKRRAAEKAMIDNERRWNLAEHLLGMKRNEYGALVPIVPVEEACTPSTESIVSSPSTEPEPKSVAISKPTRKAKLPRMISSMPSTDSQDATQSALASIDLALHEEKAALPCSH
jgi:hypothetical protein